VNSSAASPKLPDWFQYPAEIIKIRVLGLLNLQPWVVLDDERIASRFDGLRERYSSRELIPFARREDNDDVACWEKGKEPKVVVIHDFASPGYENVAEFDGFWAWFRSAIEEMIAFE